ncbi:hypothetical protein M0804_006990 [Polistes exclamans]|nr:hypothetical protein M0804_006990 [Polistes exclamans]
MPELVGIERNGTERNRLETALYSSPVGLVWLGLAWLGLAWLAPPFDSHADPYRLNEVRQRQRCLVQGPPQEKSFIKIGGLEAVTRLLDRLLEALPPPSPPAPPPPPPAVAAVPPPQSTTYLPVVPYDFN